MAVRGPIEFTAAEMAVIFAYIGLIPPFVIALVGFAVHALVRGRRERPVKPLSLFLKWWGLSTGAWIAGLIIANAVT